MDDTKNKKGKPRKKKGCLKCIFSCTSRNEEDDLAIEVSSKSQSKTELKKEQPKSSQVCIAVNTKSSSCMTDLFLFEPISQKSDKLATINKNEEINDKHRLEPITQRSPFTATNTVNSENKNLTDQLVRSILSKYLVMKNLDEVNSNGLSVAEEKPVSEEVQTFKETAKPGNDIQIEYFENQENVNLSIDSTLKDVKKSNTSSAEDNNKKLSKPKGDFPAKTKSAPTNSTAHDSLADICTKYSHFNLQEYNSDSYDSCTEENCIPKNKLELIFDKSSEEISADCEDGSAVALDYTISCENTPVYTDLNQWGILLAVTHV